jgi:hypothetical protein
MGIKKSEEEPDFIARDQRLQEIFCATNSVLSEFNSIANSIKNVSVASETIASRLASPAPSDNTVLTLAEALTGDQLPTNCVRPLQEYQQRFRASTVSGEVRNVASRLSQEGRHCPLLLALVFGAEYLYLMRFVVSVSQNVGVVPPGGSESWGM